MADYAKYVAVGRDKYSQSVGMQYTPSSAIQVRSVWFRLARRDFGEYHDVWYGSKGNTVSELTVKLYTQTTNGDAQEIPDESNELASTTIPWDDYPDEWPEQGFRSVAANFETPIHLDSGTDYWFVILMGDNFPRYGMLVAADLERTATDRTDWALEASDGDWFNTSSVWRSAEWMYGLYYRVDTEEQAAGARYHIMIDGNGYMTPGNLHSAMESTAVPFSGSMGRGRKEWSDLQFPYSAETRDNLLGGIGAERWDDNPSGYTIGTGVDTRTRGQVIIQPAVWDTNVGSTRPPRNLDIDHQTIDFPIRDTTTWYTRIAVPVQMPGSSVTVAKLRTAIARHWKGPWFTTKIRLETDGVGPAPSGTAVTDDSANDIEVTISEADVNPMMTWYTIDLSSEVGDNWTTTGNEKVWLVIETTGWPADEAAGQAGAEPYLRLRGTNDSLDTDEYSGSFYPSGYVPKVHDGSSWTNATFNSKTWAIQWDVMDDGVGQQVTDFVYWPDADKFYCVAGKLWEWTEGANRWDGYWSEVDTGNAGGSHTDFSHALVFDGKLYVTRGPDGPIRVGTWGGASASWADVTDSIKGVWLLNANGYLWTNPLPDTIKKWSGTAWGSDITVGSDDWDVTGFALFQGQVHVAKEDGIWYVDENDIAHQRMDYSEQVNQHNGKGLTNFGELLYYNVHNAYLRWTGATIDFKGPYDDYGSVPSEWTGTIVDTVSVGKHMYAALWASTTGTSQVLAFNGIGWHPIYAPFGTAGNKVNTVYWTAGTWSGAGSVTDGGRLWIGEDSHVRFIELPDRTDNPDEWSGKTFDQYGWIELPWLDFGLREVDKFFRSIKVEAENFTAANEDNLVVRIGCYVNDGTDSTEFHFLGEFYGGQDIEATFPPEISGKAVKVLVGMEAKGADVTPVLRAFTIHALLRPPQSYVHTLQLLLGNDVRDMRGKRISRNARTMWLELKAAEASTDPVRVQLPWDGFDAFVTSLSARVIAYNEEGSRPDGDTEKVATVSLAEARE